MVSQEQITQKYLLRGDRYAKHASCVFACSDIEHWLNCLGSFSNGKSATGLLRSTNSQLLMTGEVPPASKAQECTRVYELVGDCFWQLHHEIPATVVEGGIHHVFPIAVGSDVFIDWSLDQFIPLTPGHKLWLYM